MYVGNPFVQAWHSFRVPAGNDQKMLPLGSSLLIGMMFKDGRKCSKECLATRKDLDKRLKTEITKW